jgi:hypothetical protein
VNLRHHGLSPARLARTIYAATSEVMVERLDVDDEGSTEDVPINICLPSTGRTYLIFPVDSNIPEGRVRLTCHPDPSDLGALQIDGHWGAQIRAEDAQQIQEIVKAYPECANLFYDERVVIPLEPDLITIKVPSNAFADIRRAQTVLVDPEEYAESSPDLWSLDLEPIRSHLERHHQKELLSIVAQISTVAVPVDSTVLVRDIERHQLSVACLNNDGVTRFNIGYDCQIRCPGQLTDWLYQQNN